MFDSAKTVGVVGELQQSLPQAAEDINFERVFAFDKNKQQCIALPLDGSGLVQLKR
ncbi:hypothetical protein NBRC116587_34930 [Pseudoteredinibacter isoporae]